MEYLINEELIGLINSGELSLTKIKDLVYIKEFIDRVSSESYLEEGALREIIKTHGTAPTVLTWGDYFQTELAFDLHRASDEEFSRAVDTVRFDIISSYLIFSEQDITFFEWVDNSYMSAMENHEILTAEEIEEAMHLKILMDYYTNLGLINGFTSEELKWHRAFESAAAV